MFAIRLGRLQNDYKMNGLSLGIQRNEQRGSLQPRLALPLPGGEGNGKGWGDPPPRAKPAESERGKRKGPPKGPRAKLILGSITAPGSNIIAHHAPKVKQKNHSAPEAQSRGGGDAPNAGEGPPPGRPPAREPRGRGETATAPAAEEPTPRHKIAPGGTRTRREAPGAQDQGGQ